MVTRAFAAAPTARPGTKVPPANRSTTAAARAAGFIAAALSALLIISAVSTTAAAWTVRGIAICSAALDQADPMIVSDGAGGAIVVWEDHRSADWDVYAQRIDGAGKSLWTADGLVIASAAGTEDLLQVVAGASGEAIILWKRGTDIYAQKINASGAKVWTSSGVRINPANEPLVSVMTTDGAGGAIVAWTEYRSGSNNVYAQRLGYNGTLMWGALGVTVSAAAGGESDPAIAPDGVGGALIAFVNNATATPNVYVQRVRASGAIWGAGGVAVGTNTYSRLNPAIASDGAGGAIVTWEAGTSDREIGAQRISATGALSWASGGIYVCFNDGDQYNPEIIEDGAGGAVIVWRDRRNDEPQLFAQKIDEFGQAIWTANGVPVMGNHHDPEYHRLIASGSGRVLVVWAEISGGQSVRARILNIAGGVEWGADGVDVLSGDLTFGQYGAISDGAGGLLATAANDGPSESIDIFAQGINRFGRVSVPEPKILDVTDVPGDQGGKLRIRFAASDRDSIGVPGGGVASYGVWQRIDDEGMLAELRRAAELGEDAAAALGRDAAAEAAALTPGRSALNEDGHAAAALVPGAAGETTAFIPGAWLILYKGRRFIEAAPDGIFPSGSWEYVGGLDAAQSQEYIYRATTVEDSSSAGAHYSIYVVSAHSADPAVWFMSDPDSGYSVDNLAPAPPEGLAGEQSFSPIGLSLTWSMNAENDLSRYAVYRGTSEDFVPAPGNLAATPTEPEWFDSGWRWDSGCYYKVSAIDVHGNESGYALLGPDNVTGTDSPRAPKASYLAQNCPNPFNPMTKIAFGLKARSTVKLGVYDASGRLVRMLVEDARAAGHYTELWDGRDARGATVASGLYFYRLQAGGFTETRKMVLLR